MVPAALIRSRRFYALLLCVSVLFLLSIFYSIRAGFGIRRTGPTPAPRPHPIYKPTKNEDVPPIVDNFPLAATANSSADLPPIPSWNKPPSPHLNDSTPLFIGFTRNWRLLQQAVVSYITAGWPPEDIYVVENTGTMKSNENGRLSLQNPFYLDHRRLISVFGVNVLTTPTLLSFAQLQNFFLATALDRGLDHYFWGHMDVVALSDESRKPFVSLYMRAVEALRENLSPDYARDEKGRSGRWAIRFFAYDRLALVNTAAYEEVGGWDTMIPFYLTDCDMHSRLGMAGLKQEDAYAGLIYDLGTSLDDLITLYRRASQKADTDAQPEPSNEPNPLTAPEDTIDSDEYRALVQKLDEMQVDKNGREEGRNFWQSRQTGGKGEPYYRDPEGFETAIQMTIKHGRTVFAEKWGHRDCDLIDVGLGPDDPWRVEHDWT